MPTVPVLQMDTIDAHKLRSPAASVNKQPSAHTRQSWSDIARERPSATIPIVQVARGFVQSGFCEVAVNLRGPGSVAPRDLTEPSRFKNPLGPIRLLRIFILQVLRGDFCNTICHERTSTTLINHLVSTRQQHRRHGDAECPGRLQVDDELEFGRLHDRQVRRFLAL
jgi:hypothetical protein